VTNILADSLPCFRPYDLAAFLKQVHRIERLESLKEIISSRKGIVVIGA